MENAKEVVDGFEDARLGTPTQGSIGIDVDINLLKWRREASSTLYMGERTPKKVIFIKLRQIEVSFLKIPKFRMECYPL